MSTQPLISASRFYQRWLSAAPERAAQITQLVRAPLDGLDFAAALAEQSNAATPPLPAERAMRRDRKSVV